MREYGSNINLPSLDNLFSSEQERQDAKLEKIQILPLTELHPFRNHPFQVRDDDEMDKMVDSVKEYGVMTPAIVRPRKDGGYEIVAGHRRCHASQRAGVETMPCIVRDMDDDTAIILMVDSNCQREHILPSEKAKAYEMKLEAIPTLPSAAPFASTVTSKFIHICSWMTIPWVLSGMICTLNFGRVTILPKQRRSI